MLDFYTFTKDYDYVIVTNDQTDKVRKIAINGNGEIIFRYYSLTFIKNVKSGDIFQINNTYSVYDGGLYFYFYYINLL